MNIIMGDNKSGRSSFAIKFTSELYDKMNDRVRIVVPDTDHIKSLMALAYEKEIDIPEPITFADFISGRFKPEDQDSFIFDDLDLSLEHYAFGNNCVAAIVKNDGFKFIETNENRENS